MTVLQENLQKQSNIKALESPKIPPQPALLGAPFVSNFILKPIDIKQSCSTNMQVALQELRIKVVNARLLNTPFRGCLLEQASRAYLNRQLPR